MKINCNKNTTANGASDKINKNNNKIIMPLATASWLKQNTKLTEKQIMGFCQLTLIEFKMIPDHLASSFNPLHINISPEELSRCEKIPHRTPKSCFDFKTLQHKRCGKSALSVAQKHKKINYLAWLKINYSDSPICLQALAKTLRMQNSNLEKKWSDNYTGVEAIDPIDDQVCSVDHLKNKVLINCECCEHS